MKNLFFAVFILLLLPMTSYSSSSEEVCPFDQPLPQDLALKLSLFNSGMDPVDILAELESLPVNSARMLFIKLDRELGRKLWDIKIQKAYESRAAEIEMDPAKKAAFEEAVAISKALRKPYKMESMLARIKASRRALDSAFGEEFTTTTFYSIGRWDVEDNSAYLSPGCNCFDDRDCKGNTCVWGRGECDMTRSGCGPDWDMSCIGLCYRFR